MATLTIGIKTHGRVESALCQNDGTLAATLAALGRNYTTPAAVHTLISALGRVACAASEPVAGVCLFDSSTSGWTWAAEAVQS